ncbi:unnamed protein product [Sphagnum tenellum]
MKLRSTTRPNRASIAKVSTRVKRTKQESTAKRNLRKATNKQTAATICPTAPPTSRLSLPRSSKLHGSGEKEKHAALTCDSFTSTDVSTQADLPRRGRGVHKSSSAQMTSTKSTQTYDDEIEIGVGMEIDRGAIKEVEMATGDKNQDNETAIRLIGRCPLLKKFDGHYRKDSSRLAIYALQNCPQLEHLESIEVNGNVGELLNAITMHGENVSELSLYGSWELRVLEDCAGSLKHITKLTIETDEIPISGDALRALGNNCTNLVSLDLKMDDIDADGTGYLLEKIYKTLTWLNISVGNFYASEYRSLRKCEELTCLTITYAFGMADLNLLEIISELPLLRELNITCMYGLRREEYTRAFSSNKFRNLRALVAYYWEDFGDEGLKAIADNCPELAMFSLSKCVQVSDIGMRHLLLNSKSLCHLKTGQSPIADEGGFRPN